MNGISVGVWLMTCAGEYRGIVTAVTRKTVRVMWKYVGVGGTHAWGVEYPVADVDTALNTGSLILVDVGGL